MFYFCAPLSAHHTRHPAPRLRWKSLWSPCRLRVHLCPWGMQEGWGARMQLLQCSMALCSLVGADVTWSLQLLEEQQGRAPSAEVPSGSQSRASARVLPSAAATTHPKSPPAPALHFPHSPAPSQAVCTSTHWVPASRLHVLNLPLHW